MNGLNLYFRFVEKYSVYLSLLSDGRMIYRIGLSSSVPESSGRITVPSGCIADELEKIEQGMLGANVAYKLNCYALAGSRKCLAMFAELLQIPHGYVITYAALARRIGVERGGRFAGNAMAKNILPIVYPCHRVIPASGRVGNYAYGNNLKRQLLAAEGVLFSSEDSIAQSRILRS